VSLDIADEGDTEVDDTIKELKELIPFLKTAKEFITKSNADRDEKVATIEEGIDAVQNRIEEVAKDIVNAKNRVIIGQKDLDYEQKVDFGKFFGSMYRLKVAPSMEHANRIKELQDKYMSPAQKALQEGTDSEGGYLVPELFRDQIWRVVEQASVAMRDALVIPNMKGKTLPVLSLASGVSVSWVDEEAASVASDPAFGKATQDFKKMLAHTIISNELLEDEETGLTNLLIVLFGEAMGAEIDAQVFDGSGSPFTGVLRTSGVNTETMTNTEIANVTIDNCFNADTLLKASVKNGMKWYMHRTILNVLRKTKASTSGNYLWVDAVNGNPGTLAGIPYEQVEAMPSTADQALNKGFIALGNMKNYIIGTKGGMTVKVSDELRMLNDQTVFVFRQRMAAIAGLAAAFAVIKTKVSS